MVDGEKPVIIVMEEQPDDCYDLENRLEFSQVAGGNDYSLGGSDAPQAGNDDFPAEND